MSDADLLTARQVKTEFRDHSGDPKRPWCRQGCPHLRGKRPTRRRVSMVVLRRDGVCTRRRVSHYLRSEMEEIQRTRQDFHGSVFTDKEGIWISTPEAGRRHGLDQNTLIRFSERHCSTRGADHPPRQRLRACRGAARVSTRYFLAQGGLPATRQWAVPTSRRNPHRQERYQVALGKRRGHGSVLD